MNPEDLHKQATRVSRTHEEQLCALSEIDRAHHGLLDAILNAARPALDAICSPLPSTLGPHRMGLLISRDAGQDIYWCDDGTLFMDRDDSVCAISTEQMIEICGSNGVVDATTRVATAIDAQARGNKGKSIAKIFRHADQLRALAVLVRGLA